MASSSKLKDAFNADLIYGAFFTGGLVHCTKDGKELLCQNNNCVKVLDIESGLVTQTIGNADSDEDEDTVITYTLSSDNEYVVISFKSGLLKLYSKSEGRILKMWRSIHKGPISRMALNENKQLATGGCDGAIRLWDLNYQACTHNLKGSQGVISVVKYKTANEVFGASDDNKIRAWNTETGNLILTLSGHYSHVSDFDFHPDGIHLASCSRDKVIILWNTNDKTSKKVIPTFESTEGIVILPKKFELPNSKVDSNDIHVACAGESGSVKIWNMSSAKEIFVQNNSLISKATEEGGLSITQLLFDYINNNFTVVGSDHNLIIHSLETFDCIKQFSGFSDEILDVVYIGPDDMLLAVATNSADIKVYDSKNMSCQLLKGHTDLVLSLAKSSANPNILVSSSKDNTIRLWLRDEKLSKITCIGIGSRHTNSVGSVALSNLSTDFAVSVSQDNCVKMWQISDKLLKKTKDLSLICTHTEIAHQKDINCVTVSPNDKLIATCSQDKTVKLWSAENLRELGVLRGHRRGVWTARFSPVDQVILTTSADCSIKLWSVTDMTCLKTLEGHDSSVLRAEFITKGLQIISSGADGLIKLWNIKTSECGLTLDQHEGRVWALTVSADENYLVTGGSDSILIRWKDVTIEKREEELEKEREMIEQEQELNNLLQQNELLKALRVALKLNRPRQILQIINKVINTGDVGFKDVIGQLKNDHKELLLNAAVEWNSNSRNCHVAQLVLNILLKDLMVGDFRPTNYRTLLEDLLPYTERHFKRMTKRIEDFHVLTYVIEKMEATSKQV